MTYSVHLLLREADLGIGCAGKRWRVVDTSGSIGRPRGEEQQEASERIEECRGEVRERRSHVLLNDLWNVRSVLLLDGLPRCVPNTLHRARIVRLLFGLGRVADCSEQRNWFWPLDVESVEQVLQADALVADRISEYRWLGPRLWRVLDHLKMVSCLRPPSPLTFAQQEPGTAGCCLVLAARAQALPLWNIYAIYRLYY